MAFTVPKILCRSPDDVVSQVLVSKVFTQNPLVGTVRSSVKGLSKVCAGSGQDVKTEGGPGRARVC